MPKVIDIHVHLAALTAGRGCVSGKLFNGIPFRFIRWRFGISGDGQRCEQGFESVLAKLIDSTPELDAAVILAFDAVYDCEGNYDPARTQFHVTNDHVMEVVGRHRKMLFGASIHPYRKDAVAELERCAAAGAVLVKWLPLTQGMDPADDLCIPFYEAMAHFGMPLLCHTGGERSLPNVNPALADPRVLTMALKRGVKVIAAHCGTRSAPFETDYLDQFMHMAHEFEHLYGDTAALSLPTRSHAYEKVLADEVVRRKLVHGSDWPIIPMPPVTRLGLSAAAELWMENNWLRRDILIKRRLGFDEEYWGRAARILRVGRAECQ